MADSELTIRMSLSLTELGRTHEVPNPTHIIAQLIEQAWNLLGTFVEDMLEELGEEVTDEHYREVFIELCYFLIMREMTTLYLLPIQEQAALSAIKKGKRYLGPRKSKG